MIDRSETARAMAKAIAYKQCGKQKEAEQWARELVRLLECADILRSSNPAFTPRWPLPRSLSFWPFWPLSEGSNRPWNNLFAIGLLRRAPMGAALISPMT
jgi:hypothetical protein